MNAKQKLLSKVPDAEKRLKKHIDGLNKLMSEITVHFPDAQYYLENVCNFIVILSETHNENGKAQHQNVALTEYLAGASGGGF